MAELPRLAAYLDCAATTPVGPEATAAMIAACGGPAPDGGSDGAFANPSSLHRWGLAASAVLADARRNVAVSLGGQADEVHFTSGGTESNHLAVLGFCRAHARRGRHVVTTTVEHSSVRTACDVLRGEGFEVTEVPIGADGTLDASAFLEAVRPDTVLCTLAHVNNEVGAVQPVEAIAAGLAHRRVQPPLALHVDGVQALCKVPTPYGPWGVDLATVSAHKIGGPKGAGALWARRGRRLQPPVPGGSQEDGLRPGTENVPGIAAFGAAVRAAGGHDLGRLRALRRRLWDGLHLALPGLRRNGPPVDEARAAPHILNVAFDAVAAVPAEVLLHALEAEGIACSAGSACHARRAEPSHVLMAMGLPPRRAAASLRFSIGPQTSDDEVAWAVARIPLALRRLAAPLAARGADRA